MPPTYIRLSMNRKYIFLIFCWAALFLPVAAARAAVTDSVPTVGEGKFVSIPREPLAPGDELPLFTTRVAVGSDFANTSFTVKAEYPEYEKLTAAESAVLAAADSLWGEEVAVGSRLATERKQGVIDVWFYPYVRRGGAYYRLKSCKIAVYRSVQASARSLRAGQQQERYVGHSVLAQGKWVKIRVAEEGVYQLSKSFLASAGFSNPDGVKLYGYGGLVQDSVITYSGTGANYDDLTEIPLYRDGSKLLFYADGTTRWRYVRSKWRHVNNPYSSYSYYFLTEGDTPAAMQDAEAQAASGEARTTFPGRALYEQDAYSWYSGGQQFYDGYDFANGNSKSYAVDAPDIDTSAAQYVTVSFSASDASSATTVKSEVGGATLGTMNIPLLNNSNLGEQGNRARILEKTYATTALAAHNNVAFTTTAGHAARLDYIRLNYTRNANLSTPWFELCDPAHSGAGTYAIASADNNTRVWRLGNAQRAQQNVAGSLSGSTLSVVLPEASDRYIVVNTAGAFPAPELVGTVENQDLHADSVYDMVIIVPASGKLVKQAERLAAAHEAHDGLRVRVVTADKIYNEFSSGTPDAMAYRRYMKMLYDRAADASQMPRYLLLFGDAAWDNRMVTSQWANYSPDDFLLCHESWNSINEIYCYVSDDFFTVLDDGEGKSITSEKPDIAVGRFPVRTEAEAKAMVDKTISYMYNNNVGAWKNIVCVMGDDDKSSNSLMSDAEQIASQVESQHKEYNVRRVYWDAYTVSKTSTGNSYPEITKQLKSYMTSGALLMNYTGHGAPGSISHEKVLLLNDFKENKTSNYPVWITSSCEITPFDGQEECIGESAVLNASGGAVAFIGATRSVFSTRNLNLNVHLMKYILSQTDGKTMTMGEALMNAKCALVTSSSAQQDYTINKLKYVLTGDPALSLAAPTGRLIVDSIDGRSAKAGTVKLAAGSVARVSGHVEGSDGGVDSGFNGIVSTTVYDRLELITCHDNAGNGKDPFTFSNRTRRLFEGSDSVRSGRFAFDFPVSVDASYSDETCLMNLYASNGDHSLECHGVNSNFAINTSGVISNDSTGPRLAVYLNSTDFRNGDLTNTTPYFFAALADSDGINATGSGVGHDLELIIDGSAATTYVLNDYYTNDIGTFTSGTVGYSIPELEPGSHSLVFRAWDMLGNSSLAALDFVAVRNLKPDILDITCNPSPATEKAVFSVSYNRPATEMQFVVKVYDSYGQQVWSTATSGSADDGNFSVDWNLCSSAGARVSGGVYLYRVEVSEGNGAARSKTKKLIVLNNK